MRKATLPLLALALLITDGWAQTYQVETGVIASKSNVDNIQGDLNALAVFGIYHFLPVQTGTYPLAEAAFLQESNNVYAVAGKEDVGFADINHATVGIEHYVSNTIFYARADLTVSRVDGEGLDDSETDWSLTAGITPGRGFKLTTSYTEEAGYDPNLSAKYITGLGAGNFVNIEATVYDYEEDTFTSVAADYYLDRTLSVGVLIEDYSNTGYGIRAKKFFTMDLSGGVSYTNSDSSDTIRVDAAYRF